MQAVYVVGGRQRPGGHAKAEWNRYGEAVIARLDPDGGALEPCVRYTSPPETCPDDDPAILFKAGSVQGDRLYVCTQTELLAYTLPGFERAWYLSLPCMNDVHHVRPTPAGTLMVANTGLDMVLEVDSDGNVKREWSALGEDTWARFSRTTDYRKVPTTKPHHAHPNYIFYLDDEPWVTRFIQRDAICLADPGRRIEIAVEGPHDGVVHEGKVYFTTVDGHVVIADTGTLRVDEVVDLNEIASQGQPLGWCRGLLVDSPRAVLVGFSRLRPTAIRENLRWLAHGAGLRRDRGATPSWVGVFDLVDRRLLARREVEKAGLDAVFSIHRAP